MGDHNHGEGLDFNHEVIFAHAAARCQRGSETASEFERGSIDPCDWRGKEFRVKT
jgi:hypothetical protein